MTLEFAAHSRIATRSGVLVRVRPAAIAEIKAFYDGMQKRMFALWSEYSETDIETISDFLSRSTDLAVECMKPLSD